jgi:hypothetical protein
MHAHTCTHTHTYTHTRARTRTHARTHAHTHTCTHIRTFPHTRRELKRARHIGSFESEVDAAHAYDREALKMLGTDAGLNFRESGFLLVCVCVYAGK